MRTFFSVLILGAFATAAFAATMDEIDANSDGMVSLDELQAAMPDITEEAFSLADANQDGLIDADEFGTAQEAGILPAG